MAAAKRGAAERDLDDLAALLAAFNETTAKLKASHDRLQERVSELTGELARKNEELAVTLAEVSALKNYLANILESITDGVLAVDLDGCLVAVNQAAREIIPEMPTEREGRAAPLCLPPLARELQDILARALAEQRRFTNVEIGLNRGDGRRFLAVSASPIRDSAGALLGAVATFRDLTEHKDLEARARRQDRLAALGEMAAGVAHEIRNPLGGIELYASNLRRNLPEESKEAETANRILNAVASLNRIVDDMLAFTRNQMPVRRPVAVEQICRTTLDLAATAIAAKRIQVETISSVANRRFPLDPDLLSHAFLNVVLNACQSMEEGGSLRIKIDLATACRGSALTVAFADNGPGVPEALREKIFNPFFTTKSQGTGLGLAIAQKIAQDHGGALAFEPNTPRGAIFIFSFPLQEVDGSVNV